MVELPTGTVTFLFTDIEGSTRLLHELGDAYADVLADHRRALRECFNRHGGVEVDTQGDAFFVAFARASDALAAAVDGNAALEPSQIRVRIGLHTGEPRVTEEGYVGIDVHRAARIAAVGYGGQILVSQSTRDLAGGRGLRDLGDHRLKDLTATERIYQLGGTDFPPLKSLNQTNLPVQPTELVGRERELSEVLELLRSSRLLTFTGAGGSGKTRLALHAAAELVDDYPDGVWFVSFAALSEPDLVVPTIASTIGAKDDLVEFLKPKTSLFLLDNLEQLLPEVAATVADLLGAPNVKVLATSRERLALAAEQEYVVPTLALSEAVALFTARARQLQPSFEPDEHVTDIARHLDGLPLALELAAARIKVLSPDRIAARLTRSLDLLTAGARDAPERQRTLRATIEWSFDLLDEQEQLLFARLAVFGGSFDVEAAEAICEADLDRLQSLLDKSLLRQAAEARFFMLETIRNFAQERLSSSTASEEWRRRHAEHYSGVAAHLGGFYSSRDQGALARQFERELHNLRLAFDWFGEAADERALGMVEDLAMYFILSGRLDEGSLWANRALRAVAPGDALLVANAISTLGEFARWGAGGSARAIELKEQALGSYRELDQAPLIAATLHDLADIWAHEGEYEQARSLSLEALEIRRELGRPLGIAHALSTLADVALYEGNLPEAERLYEELLEIQIAHAPGDVDHAIFLFGLAESLRRQEHYERAAVSLKEAMAIAAGLRMRWLIPDMLHTAAALTSRSDARSAAVLVGAAEAIRSDAGLDYFDVAEWERIVLLLQESLGEADLAAARLEGAEMTVDAALHAAVESLD